MNAELVKQIFEAFRDQGRLQELENEERKNQSEQETNAERIDTSQIEIGRLRKRVDELENRLESEGVRVSESDSSEADEKSDSSDVQESEDDEKDEFDIKDVPEGILEVLEELNTEEFLTSEQLSDRTGIKNSTVNWRFMELKNRMGRDRYDQIIETNPNKGRRLTETGVEFVEILEKSERYDPEDSSDEKFPLNHRPSDKSHRIVKNAVTKRLKDLREDEGKFSGLTIHELLKDVYGIENRSSTDSDYNKVSNACYRADYIESFKPSDTNRNQMKYRINPKVDPESIP